jgi:hypothetical protein
MKIFNKIKHGINIRQEWSRIITSDYFLLFAIVFVSLIIKILFAGKNPDINPDGVLYISAAKQIAAGNFRAAFEIYSMPFYPLLIAFIHLLVHDWVLSARLISLISMLFAIFPLYLITREMFNPRAALWSCLVFALVPIPNGWAIDVIRDPAFIFCFAWSIYFCLQVIVLKKTIYCFAATLCALLALLFRIEGIVLFAVIFFSFTVFLLHNPSQWKFWTHNIGTLVLLSLLLGMILVGTAFLIDTNSLHRLNEVGTEVENITRLDFLENYHTLYDELKRLEGTPPFSHGNQNILTITRHYMAIIYMFGIIENMVRVLFPVFMIPLFRGFGHRWEKSHVFVMVAAVAYLLIVYYSLINRDFLEIRFIFAPVFLMYPWVGHGLDHIWSKIHKTAHPKILSGIFLILFIITPLYKTGTKISSEDSTLREAGQWVARSPEFANARLTTTDSRIAFYADKKGGSFLSISFKQMKNSYIEIEKTAIQDKAELIGEKVKRGQEPFKDFQHFQIIKTFKGKNNYVHFYKFMQD